MQMEIQNIDSFLKYFGKIKQRTIRLFEYIPPEKMEWTYKTGKFTFGALIRHLAAIERFMYAETVSGRPSLYAGCGTELAEGYEATIAYYHQLHEESAAIFKQLSPAQLQQKCNTPAGIPITTWKWLRAMVEHEVHHRGQIYTYLGLLDIATPPIFGLTSEEVAAKSAQ